MKVAYALLFLYVASVFGDVYMHNPRGSNDRLNEANTNRNNANRVFDSQNNAKGGYCYGPAMSYYEGSLLSVEWTAQHGCGNSKLYCNIVIQYMCSESNADPEVRVRDGTTTDTIPDTPAGPTTVDANGELRYGMHESYQFYQDCKARNRNIGLWIADREEEGGLTLGRRSSIFTRQNNNGNRHGYECVEERDYYPYWAPSPWKDVVIFTHDEKYCDFYQKESQNVADKFYCADENGNQLKPITSEECGQLTPTKGEWTKVKSHDIPAPECIVAAFARDNHLGNGHGGQNNMYNWTLPTSKNEKCIKDNNCNCVLRIRYNISTADLSLLEDGAIDGNSPSEGFIDWKQNAGNSPIYDDQILPGSGMDHQLALDTTQFGRTFQDRSHVFHIKSRKDSGVPSKARVFNLNVRGKRGNIVQAYPSVEYDFIPEILYVRVGDYIHFQWTGCDTNPAGNAGEGTDQTDRSNVVQIKDMGANTPASDAWIDEKKGRALFPDPVLRKRMAFLDQEGCLDYETLLKENGNNQNNAEQDVRNCMKLNAASQYFDGGAIKMNNTKEDGFFYMSSRNNNFSNRGQKGVIIVSNLLPGWAIGVVAGGAALFVGAAGVAGAAFYAKSHPHSSLANVFSKL